MQHSPSARRAALVAALLLGPGLLSSAVWGSFLGAKGPYWLGNNLDPDYVYLLNGLNVLSGYAPGHVDHPGTPVQVLVAGVIAATHAWAGPTPVADDVLGRPEHYLLAANGALRVLVALALAWAGFATWRATGSVAATLAVQLVPALGARALSQVACVKPEPLLLALVAALAAAIMGALASKREPGVPHGVLLGVIVGVAACTKITAAPLALLPLLFLRGWAARLSFLAAAGIAFAGSLVPAFESFGLFRAFVTRIATHSGPYGTGAPGVFSVAAFAFGLFETLRRNPDLVAVLITGALVWALARRSAALREDRAVRALGGVLAAQLATVLLVARHPGLHYVLPASALSGLAVALVLHVWPRAVELPRAAVAAVLALAAFLCAREAAQGLARHRAFERARAEQLAAAAAARSVPGATVVHYYRSSDQVYALRFADELSAGRWTSWLDAHHAGAVFYSPFSRSFASYGAKGLPPAPGAPIVFQGTTLGVEPFTDALAGRGLTPILEGRVESVYLAPGLW